MRISVTTPTVRPELIDIVKRSLDRQTLKDFQWLLGVPEDKVDEFARKIEGSSFLYQVSAEPEKREGDFYNLNKCWNMLFGQAEGELVVNIVDGLWFPPDTLAKLWMHYEANQKACVTCVGNQYETIENGKPEGLLWRDPRKRADFGSFYEVSPREMELCIASLPREGIYKVGGVDEKYDKVAALSEKEMCWRMDKAGYKFYIDQSIEYRAITHPRLKGSDEWDKHYFLACDMFEQDFKDIGEGRRVEI